MNFETCFKSSQIILMEGAVGERLKREYNIKLDENIALAGLIYHTDAKKAMQNIYLEYIAIAEKYNLPFIATTPTRRANVDRIKKSIYDESVINENVRFLKEIRDTSKTEMFIGGLMGCKGDAYKATEILSIEDAYKFHTWQANLFKESEVDFLFAGIMPALSEAIGMAKAMGKTGLPYIISFMIRDDGKLIDGTTIHNAIETIDNLTEKKPICYMVNCIHPIVLRKALICPFNSTKLVKERFCGIQANTSFLSPEELDNCKDLKYSDSKSLASDMIDLYNYFNPKIFGGCCGTDNIHIEEIAKRLIGQK
jgi:S-methylmethionine-dependent homocysteine/selenocysteine methylase